VKQITIVAEVKAGLVADISRRLGDAGINIESVDAFEARTWDIVQLTVSDYDRALQVLRDGGYDAISEDAVVINVKDEPGALAQVTRRLYDGGVDMRSMRLLHRQAGEALVAISMDRTDVGMQLISDLLVNRAN